MDSAGRNIEEGLHIHVAAGFLHRARGLLGRAPLHGNEALLIPGCCAVHTCGMRYPIDVVFVDAAGVVLAVAEELAPWHYAAQRRAASVLEFTAGGALRHGFVPGAQWRAFARGPG